MRLSTTYSNKHVLRAFGTYTRILRMLSHSHNAYASSTCISQNTAKTPENIGQDSSVDSAMYCESQVLFLDTLVNRIELPFLTKQLSAIQKLACPQLRYFKASHLKGCQGQRAARVRHE